MISVIIRSKNEDEWLHQCLTAVFRQDLVKFEVILIDNESTDQTLTIAKKFNCKILTIAKSDFSFGKALNDGIKASSGDLLCCLSAHCIPEHTYWLYRMALNFTDPTIAGAYGRQLPVQSTNPLDKRDLWNTFGLERKIQTIDPFFHNANSMLRRSVWSKIPFDEAANGIEDRIWAKAVLATGLKIAYDPSAAVYHPHGLNHAGDLDRASRVVKMIEENNLY